MSPDSTRVLDEHAITFANLFIQGPSPNLLDGALRALASLATISNTPTDIGPDDYQQYQSDDLSSSTEFVGVGGAQCDALDVAAWLMQQPLQPLSALLSHASPRVQARALRLLLPRTSSSAAAAEATAMGMVERLAGMAAGASAQHAVRLGAIRALQRLLSADPVAGGTLGSTVAAMHRARLADALVNQLLQPNASAAAAAAAAAAAPPKGSKGAGVGGAAAAAAAAADAQRAALDFQSARLLAALLEASPATAEELIAAGAVEALAALLPDAPPPEKVNNPHLAGAAGAEAQAAAMAADTASRPQTSSSRPHTTSSSRPPTESSRAPNPGSEGLGAVPAGSRPGTTGNIEVPAGGHEAGRASLSTAATAAEVPLDPRAASPAGMGPQPTPAAASAAYQLPAHKAVSLQLQGEVLAVLAALLASQELSAQLLLSAPVQEPAFPEPPAAEAGRPSSTYSCRAVTPVRSGSAGAVATEQQPLQEHLKQVPGQDPCASASQHQQAASDRQATIQGPCPGLVAADIRQQHQQQQDRQPEERTPVPALTPFGINLLGQLLKILTPAPPTPQATSEQSMGGVAEGGKAKKASEAGGRSSVSKVRKCLLRIGHDAVQYLRCMRLNNGLCFRFVFTFAHQHVATRELTAAWTLTFVCT